MQAKGHGSGSMVKTLQKKFIITAMAAVSLLLVALIGGINITNCIVAGRQSGRQLEMLADTERQLMEQGKPGIHKDGLLHFFKPPKPGKAKGGDLFNPPIDEDMAMSLRFFVVRLGEDGEAGQADVSRISSVGREEAVGYAGQAVQQNKEYGHVDNFKFKTVIVDNAKAIVFLDVSGQFRSMVAVFAVSASIAAVCWFFMLLFVILLSRRAIRPIAENIQRQKQFVTDAGHELKTPLAIIQANVDAMELINGETKWSRNIKQQSIRLSSLTQDLLTLAKIDEAGHEIRMENINISSLFHESLQSFYEAAALREITVECSIQPGIFLCVNRSYIQQLASILFDNAVKYADEGGRICVSLCRQEKGMVLEVTNSCEKLPQEPADKLFGRFYRPDSARTQKKGGYGIGLSAAYAIVAAHKGSIRARYLEGNKIMFQVVL